MSSAYWTNADVTLLLGSLSTSLQLSVSEDKVHFGAVTDPLILYDAYDWTRPASTELYAYPSMIAAGGFNNVADRFFLTSMYVPPGADFSQRYLVAQEGRIEASAVAQSPQVRTALSRWIDADGDSWTTSGPTVSPQHSYSFDRGLGYVMTAPPQRSAGVKLDECFSEPGGQGFLAPAGRCAAAGSARRRPGGYVFQSQQPGTIALYSCRTRDDARFMSNRSDCEDKGLREGLLGFVLQ
jgi:hypothetical protein